MQRDHFLAKLIAVSLIANIAITWTAILVLPSHSSTLAATSSFQGATAVKTRSNSALKGDRLVVSHAAIENAKAVTRKTAVRIPVGCDSAFSKLVKSSFAARCVTSVSPATKSA